MDNDLDFPPEVAIQPENTPAEEAPPSKRLRGRPRNPVPKAKKEPKKPKKPAPSDPQPELPQFPSPPVSRQRGGTVPPEQFFGYWINLSAEYLERCMFYIYREWPVMDYMQLLTEVEREQVRKKERMKPAKYIGKYLTPWADDGTPEGTYDFRGDGQAEVLRIHGSGTYKLYLSDTNYRKAGSKSSAVCRSIVEIRLTDHPPIIPDKRAIDKNDPANQKYLEDLLLTGTIDDNMDVADITAAEKEEEMAATDVMRDVLAANEKLTDKVLSMNSEPKQAQRNGDSDTAVGAKVAEVMGDAAKLSNKMLTDTVQRVTEMSARTQDVGAQLDHLAKLAQIIKPADSGGGTTAMIEMMRLQMDQADKRHEREMENLRRQHEQQMAMQDKHNAAMLELIKGQKPAGPTVATSELSVLDKILEWKDKLNDITGSGGEAGDVPGWVPYALQGAKIVADAATNLFHNAAVARTGAGAPLTPPVTSAEPAALENPDAEFSRQIKAPLEDALKSNVPGHDFAARMILQMNTDAAYKAIAGRGKEGIIQALQAAPETFAMFQRFGAGGQNERFIDEFLDERAVMAAVHQIQRGQAPQPQQPPVNPQQPAADGERIIQTAQGPVRVVKPKGGGPKVSPGQVVDVTAEPQQPVA